jgi:hypothetical protein
MKLICTILILFFTISTQAQENKIFIGLETSVGISRLRGNPLFDNNNDYKTVLNNGLSFQYNINNTISLCSGLSFQNKGAIIPYVTIEDVNGITIGELRVDQNFSFINLPFLFRLNYGAKIKVALDLGPYLGILLHQSENTSNRESFTRNNTELYKKVELGLHTGIGSIINIGKGFFITVKINNELGLNDLGVNSTYYDLPVQTARFALAQIYKSGSVKTNTTYFRIGLLHTIK